MALNGKHNCWRRDNLLRSQVYLNGVCSAPAPVVSLCPNAPISPTMVTSSPPSTSLCPNAPISPTVVAPSNPPCPNAPVNPTICAPSCTTTCTTNCVTNWPNTVCPKSTLCMQ